jgi:GcrA cell cycle regulator
MSDWTETETRELVTLWPTSSASQIAARLKRPRGSVTGKVQRLQQDGVLPRGVKHFAMPVQPRTIGKVSLTETFCPRPSPLDDSLAMQPCTIYELDDRRCHWPLEDPGRMLFCGCPTTARGCPYCPHHLRIASRS